MLKDIRRRLIKQVCETIERYGMFEDIHRAVIGFSAGPDSVCLLDVLKRIYNNQIEFHLVYINHGLRPAKFLKREEIMTQNYAQKYFCNYSIVRIKVPKTKKGMEAEARQRRYDELIKCADEISAQRIVLGHNLDDLVETFFINLIRGSGTLGLQAMPAVRLPFVRPLIDVRKSDIISYLELRNLKFCSDLSNRDLNIRRNLIRRKIMPQLLMLNPQLHNVIRREIEILRNGEEFIQNQVKRVYQGIVKQKHSGLTIDFNRLMHYNKAVKSRIIMSMIRSLKGDLVGINAKHIEEILGLTYKTSGKRVILPNGLYAQRRYNEIFLGKLECVEKRNIYKPVKIGTEVEIANIRLRLDLVKGSRVEYPIVNCEVFDFDQLTVPVFIRSKIAGDVVRIKNGRKKLKEILNEAKVPVNERDSVLLLCDQRGILWVVGIYRAFRAFVDPNTRKTLKVQFEYID